MRKLHIFILSAVLLAAAGCSKDKDFNFNVNRVANVSFSAINLTVGSPDSASSTVYDGYFYEKYGRESENDNFKIEYINQGSGENYTYYVEVHLDCSNALWSGGYNEIRFTFKPSCPEEKEAKFTMPDGQEFVATLENPSFTWTVGEKAIEYSNLWDGYRLVVTAESSYTHNGDSVTGIGFILINVNQSEGSRLAFNKNDGKWYWDEWMNNQTLTVYKNVDFSVENITVGDRDSARSKLLLNESYNYDNRETDETLELQLYQLIDSAPQQSFVENVRLYYTNQLWAGGDNQLKITFHPGEIKDTKLFLPDGKDVYLTAQDSVYIWTLDRETMANIRYTGYNGEPVIIAENNIIDGPVETRYSGFVGIQVNEYVRYDAERKLWLYDYWTGTRSAAHRK